MVALLVFIALSFLFAFVAWVALIIVTLITDPLNFWAWMGAVTIGLILWEGRSRK